ncbi:MAG: glycoside hydrolase family 3 C-terminal domain-containing protein [Acidobacteriota bacterium]
MVGSGGTIQLGWIPPADAALDETVTLVKDSDVAIVFVGLSSELEGEEMLGIDIPDFLGGDRTSLDLPEPQENLIEAAIATGKPVVVVLTSLKDNIIELDPFRVIRSKNVKYF